MLRSPMTLFSKKKMYKENVDFQFYDIEDYGLTAIKILRGEFKDVLYYYQGASISEEGEMARLKFGYQVLEAGSFSVEFLTNSEEFNTLMGDLLSQLIIKEDVYGQTGTIDTEEFDL